jgi:hypothetical protein
MRCFPQILSTFVAYLSFTALASAQTTTTSESPASRTSVASTGGIEDMTQTTMTSPSPTTPTNSTSASQASTAHTTSPATSSAPRTAPTSDSQVPPKPSKPRVEPTDNTNSRIRDGFYTRVTFGLGYLSMSGKGPRGRVSISGMSDDSMIAIGGTLVRGLVLAGTLQGATATGTFKGGPFEGETVTSNGKSQSASSHADASSSQIGLLIDWYPRPSLGWHTGLSGGLGAASVVNHADDSTMAGASTSGSIFGGYDWSIGPAWSFGLLLIGSGNSYTSMKYTSDQSEAGYRLRSYSLCLSGSILYF